MGASPKLVSNSSDVALEQTSPLFSSSTLIDSTPGVLAAWDSFGREYGFDPDAAARAGHGRRLADSLGELCNLETPEEVEVCLFFHIPPRSCSSEFEGRRVVYLSD
jgi:hypothetical protein